MKPLTIEELKALEVGDWVWVELTHCLENVDSFVEGAYCQVQSKDYYDDTVLPLRWNDNFYSLLYKDYGTKWLAYKNKGQAETKDDLYKTAFELMLQDVYEARLQADVLSCSSCPFREELFDECRNQGLYEDCKKRWRDYYIFEAERRLVELKE